MGAGAVLLANSRPYEGFLFCVPVGIAMIAWLCSSRSPALKVTGKRILLPLVGMLALTAVSLGYYHWRVTGNPLLLPHVLYNTEYINYRVLIWEKLHPPLQYANRQFELYFNVWLRGPHKWGAKQLFVMFGQFFLGSVLLYRLCRDTALDSARPPGSISVDPVRFQHCRIVARRRNFPGPPSGTPRGNRVPIAGTGDSTSAMLAGQAAPDWNFSNAPGGNSRTRQDCFLYCPATLAGRSRRAGTREPGQATGCNAECPACHRPIFARSFPVCRVCL